MSVAGDIPLANREKSASLLSVVPLAETNEPGLRIVQLAVTSPPVGSPSQNKLRSSVVTDKRKRPNVCCGFEWVWINVKVRMLPPEKPISVTVSKAAVWDGIEVVYGVGEIAQPRSSAVVPLIALATE